MSNQTDDVEWLRRALNEAADSFLRWLAWNGTCRHDFEHHSWGAMRAYLVKRWMRQSKYR